MTVTAKQVGARIHVDISGLGYTVILRDEEARALAIELNTLYAMKARKNKYDTPVQLPCDVGD